MVRECVSPTFSWSYDAFSTLENLSVIRRVLIRTDTLCHSVLRPNGAAAD